MAAGSDSQKHLLTIIRDVATEKSQGGDDCTLLFAPFGYRERVGKEEKIWSKGGDDPTGYIYKDQRRVVGLKKQIEELRPELDEANGELEHAKRCKEMIEQEIKGYEVELCMIDTSIHTLEARISLIQDEISTACSDSETLKNEEGALRDDFINKMFEFNIMIRKFQEAIASNFQKEDCVGTSPGHILVKEKDTEADSRNLKDELANIVAESTMMEQEIAIEQSIHEQVQQELIGLDRKVSLMAGIVKETKELQELTSYELEEKCTSLGEELQRRSLCPSCHLNNVEAIGGILQENEEN